VPKVTAVFRVYQNSKYDGTCWRAELKDVLGPDGQPDENHPLWERAEEEGLSDLFLNTDNPSVYGQPDDEQNVFGRVVQTGDFLEGGEYGKYESGETNYDVHYFRLEFEVDETGRLVPHGELVLTRYEVDVPLTGQEAQVAYFLGTPSEAQLEEVYRQEHDHLTSFNPRQVQDAVADRANLERWVL
jgi:hypothetical protein